ncbi:hypothetical protein D0469_03535 [Peribacillus saganii]|uniref:Uncharacterized protein n=1 Tax=Peribacillus saganii TaxID=2303992 RepID=A0A372LS51_9BACI|nr:hypothetical protein [Peribacillus saganii]RFU71025.1 hypothetical protein D0469_03535 [Peribacillus saganii]
MKTVQEIREIVAKAQQLQQDSTGLYRSFQDAYNQKKTEIELNRDYSPEGKRKLIESHQKRKTIELMQLARSQKDLFTKYLSEAKKDAESIIYAKTPKVDPVKQERFEKRLAEVKTEILLSNAKKGKEILSDFLSKVDEQAFAAQIKGEFVSLIQPILQDAGAEAYKYRQELSQIFEDVKSRSMDPEAGEAMQVAEYAESALDGRFFIPLVEEKAGEHLGQLAKMYINKPEQYFADFPDDDKKPLPPGMRSIEEVLEEQEAKI